MIFKKQTPKCNCLFLRNAGLVGGVVMEIDVSDFSQILAFETLFSRFSNKIKQNFGPNNGRSLRLGFPTQIFFFFSKKISLGRYTCGRRNTYLTPVN